MSYADPTRCPDCSSPLQYGAPSCPRCGLPLRGQLAQDLFVTLSRADELLAALRAAPAPVAGVPAPAAGVPAPGPTAAVPPAPAVALRPRLSSASVPKILLGLGAACLLVAALVFLAYAWSVLGVAGRTATLLGFTAVAGALAAWGARRGLRAAAESLSLVMLGLLTLDSFGARSAGWLGDITTPGFLVVLGLLLAAAAAAAALLVRRTALPTLTGAEVVAAAGTALVGAGLASLDGLASSPALVLAVLAGAAATAGARWVRLPVAAAGAAVVTAVAWLALLGSSLDRALSHPSLGALWGHLEVWPLLVAAALVAATALLPALPSWARVSALAVGYALLAVAALAPLSDETPTALVLALLGVLAVSAAVALLVPRPWGLTAALTQGGVGLAVGAVSVQLMLVAAQRLGAMAVPPWSGGPGDRLARWQDTGLPAAWVLPVSVVVLTATVLALAHAAPALGRELRPLVDVRVAAVLALLTSVATLGLYPVPVWAPVAVLALGGLGCAAAWLRSAHALLLASSLVAVAAAVVVALHAESLTEAALLAAVAGAGLVHLRGRNQTVSEAAGLLLVAGLAGAVWTGGALVDAAWPSVALVDLLVVGAVCLLAPLVPERWWVVPGGLARAGLEVGAAAVSVPVAAAGVLLAPDVDAATWAAVYLTVAGVVVVAMSLLRRDRRLLAWPGGALLALASWVRLWDVGVHEPEAYTLPSAVALLVVGMVHLRRHPRSGTTSALSAGLGLALVPSLLWSLEDPVSLRALLLGLGCFGLVMAGVRARWTAPLVWGATVGLVLVLRLAAPYIGEAVPRWVLIGAAGAALIAVGVTWERRLADARHVISYVRSLR